MEKKCEKICLFKKNLSIFCRDIKVSLSQFCFPSCITFKEENYRVIDANFTAFELMMKRYVDVDVTMSKLSREWWRVGDAKLSRVSEGCVHKVVRLY